MAPKGVIGVDNVDTTETTPRYEIRCNGELVCTAPTLDDALTDAREIDPAAGPVTIADLEARELFAAWWLL